MAGGFAHALKFDAEVPAEIRNQAIADLDFVYQIQGQGQTKLHGKIFGTVSGASYKSFFESRIQFIGLDPFKESAPQPTSFKMGFAEFLQRQIEAPKTQAATAYVSPVLGANQIWLTDQFVQGSHPQIARVMVLFHEARHSEKTRDHWAHVKCPVPFLDENGQDMVSLLSGTKLAGLDACDDTIFGSYGVSAIMLENISRYCTNCSEKIKMDADLYAKDQMRRILR